MSLPHHSTRILLKDLIALKSQAELFMLPPTGKKSTTGFGSTYSPFKSRGLDFQEVRVYQPGDDIRQIDWHVTAKYGKPFTKLYTEEKERTIFFVVDLRNNMHFATHGDFKDVIAARLAAFMAFMAEHQKDKLGYIIITDEGITSSGDADAYGVLTPMFNALTGDAKYTQVADPFNAICRALTQLLPRGAFTFLFSDFYDWNATHTDILAPLSEKTTFLFCPIYDELEIHLPDDTLSFSDGTDTLTISAHQSKLRQKFYDDWKQRTQMLETAAKKYGWGLLPIKTDSDYLADISHFCFQGRNG
ncbi:MAG: DUF58 domain-containing protein [Alphaproteobacteria bacterium]|nr:DUF58 domain-containing protein [Alphaproteobacteria bacterium]